MDRIGEADAYEKAASSPYYGYDLCYATEAVFLQPNHSADRLLADGRNCIDASTKDSNTNDTHYFTETLPNVYREMAQDLEQRGVYDQALDYVKESLNARTDNAPALDTEADIYRDLNRTSECIAAEKEAIRLSDGKYPWMQFRLGTCYVDEGDWAEAATYFRLAANADKTDAASAFNLGLCYQRQGYISDANV